MNIDELVFAARHRVMLDDCPRLGDASVITRQLDVVLVELGFKLSGKLFAALSQCDPGYVLDKALRIVAQARQLSGAHVQHNAYFIDFPANVPDTEEFWFGLLRDTVLAMAGGEGDGPRVAVGPAGVALDLLSLKGYGAYQHDYAEMVARHEAFEAVLADRLTIVHLGAPEGAESLELLASLAGSAVPLSGDKLDQLRFLAAEYPQDVIALEVPVRENRAVVSAARARQGLPPLVTTVTDVLRTAAELSGADVALEKPPRFRSQPRRTRFALMAALNGVMTRYPQQAEDVLRHAEAWKRLAERLHPHEFAQFPAAQRAFAVARGETDVTSRASRAEAAFSAGLVTSAARELAVAPGEFWRAVDRMLRVPAGEQQLWSLLRRAEQTAPHVSARVLLGVRQHLMNRVYEGGPRMFPVRSGRVWVTPDKRPPLDRVLVQDLRDVIDAEVASRLPKGQVFVFDPAVLGAALPLTGKNQGEGLGIWPRGSVSRLEAGEWLRFFFHWRQAARRTDYDLSCLFMDKAFQTAQQISYTNLRGGYAEHSGDITDAPAPKGATEFINVRLDKVPPGVVIVPQLYLFNGDGEAYSALEEQFFGYMTRDEQQRGLPFEPRTVRAKGPLTGDHRVTMPMAFYRGDDGAWYVKWLHLGVKGAPSAWRGYRTEENKVTAGLLMRHLMGRTFLQIRYLQGVLSEHNTVILPGGEWKPEAEPVTYVGVSQPEGLHPDSKVITLASLGDLVPA